MLIYVVSRGDAAYSRWTKPFIREYATKHGYDLIFADCGYRADRHPAWQKMLVHEYVNAPFVLVMDLDVIPLPWAPPIHEVLDFGKLNLCRDTGMTDEQQRAREVARGCPAFSMGFNTGLMGVPSYLAPEFQHLHERGEVIGLWWEQTEVNLWIRVTGLPVHVLPTRWNHVVQKCDETYCVPEDLRDVYFLHFAGCDVREMFAKHIYETFHEL